MRLLIDCTYVYDNPHINSGIQRVVRNIVSKLKLSNKIVEAIPVVIRNNGIYQVKQLSPAPNGASMLNRFISKLIRERTKYWLHYDRAEQVCVYHQMFKKLFFLYKTGDLFFHIVIIILSRFCQRDKIGDRIITLSIKSGDVLVLLDSSWFSDSLAYIQKLKAQGMTIVSVIYDLIPLTHPQLCNDGVVMVFHRWFEWVVQTADGFMTISRTVRDQVREHVQPLISALPGKERWFDYFHLGFELDLLKDNDLVREKVKKLFQHDPVYLMVGTIEPRKNHAYLLKAFDLLWEKNIKVCLCFVGRVGWKCKPLVKQVQNHKAFKKHLFMFHDLSDAELDYCYKNSRSLVFPAYVEGFGLPLVEAMQRGLPAMASDIPVFREVGDAFIAYFDLEKPETLEMLVRKFEENGKFPAAKTIQGWLGLNWEQSTRQFLAKVCSNVKSSKSGSLE